MADFAREGFFTARFPDGDVETALEGGIPPFRIRRPSGRPSQGVRQWWTLARLSNEGETLVGEYRLDGYDYDSNGN
jgi:hypothetical protein